VTATYLAQLSEARCINMGPSESDLGAILRSNMLFVDTMYVGSTDLLCNETLHTAIRDQASGFGDALLKPRDGRAPLLQPVMYKQRSFTELAQDILADSTVTPMKTSPEKRAQLIQHAERLDQLGPLPKIVDNGPFRYMLWESLNKSFSLLARERQRQPVLSVQAEQIRRWLDHLSPNDVKDFRQSRLWKYIATLPCDERSKRALELVSDTEYQCMMASSAGAMVSKDVRFKNYFGKRVAATSHRSVSADYIEAASTIPAPVLKSFDYMEVLTLSRMEPFERLRQLMRDAHAGRSIANAHHSLLDDCV
jgi:hypothetical protein